MILLRILLFAGALGAASGLEASTAFAAEPDAQTEIRPVVAVLRIAAEGMRLSNDSLDRMTRYLSVRLVIDGAFQTVPDSSLAKAIANLKTASHQDNCDEACQIQLGHDVSADKTLSVTVWKIEGTCQIVATLYDLRTAASRAGATVSNLKCTEKGLMSGIERLADQLSGKADAEKIEKPEPIRVQQTYPPPTVAITPERPTVNGAPEQRSRPANQYSDNPQQLRTGTVSPGRPWAVICGSVKQEDATSRQRAEGIASGLRAAGINANVYDGSRFSAFRCCYWSVIAGFFASKAEAMELVNIIRSKGFDVYTKKAF